ncbi:MAG: hypothetical protein A2168_03265 [Planctomycetes bacterium RBG_13_50_24]|nr:MAG: hypothetical protein A2168_03265 [Planctomycetes bacterium RBG_13_50_24]
MNKSLKIILLILQIGGGLLGLGLIGRTFLTKQLPQTALIIHIAFIFVFLFGIVAGVALVRKPKLGFWLSAVFQALQIPIIVIPATAYLLVSGACFNLYRHAGGFGYKFVFGSHYYFTIHSTDSWMAGINVLALVLFILLVREIRLQSVFSKICEPQPSMEYPSQAQDHQPKGSHLQHILR